MSERPPRPAEREPPYVARDYVTPTACVAVLLAIVMLALVVLALLGVVEPR